MTTKSGGQCSGLVAPGGNVKTLMTRLYTKLIKSQILNVWGGTQLSAFFKALGTSKYVIKVEESC